VAWRSSRLQGRDIVRNSRHLVGPESILRKRRPHVGPWRIEKTRKERYHMLPSIDMIQKGRHCIGTISDMRQKGRHHTGPSIDMIQMEYIIWGRGSIWYKMEDMIWGLNIDVIQKGKQYRGLSIDVIKKGRHHMVHVYRRKGNVISCDNGLSRSQSLIWNMLRVGRGVRYKYIRKTRGQLTRDGPPGCAYNCSS
jgi:hypothetical protein